MTAGKWESGYAGKQRCSPESDCNRQEDRLQVEHADLRTRVPAYYRTRVPTYPLIF
jgi:hypothetical protein